MSRPRRRGARRLSPLLFSLSLAVALGCSETREPGGDPFAEVDLAEVWSTASRAAGLLDQHEFDAAADGWRRVIDVVPFWYTARINLGIALMNQTTTEAEAREVFEGVLEAFPTTPWAHYCLGILDERASRLTEAEAHYRAVLAVDPEDPDAHLRLGLLVTTLGRPEEAIGHLQQSVAQNRQVKTGWYALASAARELGDQNLYTLAMQRFAALEAGSGGEERVGAFGKMGFYADPIRPDAWDLPRPSRGPAPAAYAVALVDGSAEAGLDDPALAHGGPGHGFFSAWLSNASVTRDYASEVSGGVAALDWDQDGDTDVFAAHWGDGPDVLALENDGTGRFAERASALGLDGDGPARTIALATADFDGDGLADLFLGRDGVDRIASRDTLAGPFRRAIEGAGGADEPTLSLAIGDIDLDGDLDLLAGRHSGVALYRWNGQRFEDVTEETRSTAKGPVFGVVLADLDGDHDVDPINGTPRVRVGVNDRLWRLRESHRDEFGALTIAASYSVGDVDGDGLVDWLIANPSEPTLLLRATPGAGFVADDALAAAGPPPAFSAFFVDVDRDGDLDVLTVGETPGLFLQDGGGWSPWTEESGLAALAPEFAGTRGSVPFDADGDGDLDLLVVRNGRTPLLVRNQTDTGPLDDWIAVLPRGIKDRTQARGRSLGPGAEVEVVAAGTTRRAWAALGGGFASVAPETLYFNLVGSERADVRIRWADLVLQTEVDQAGGQVHAIEQVNRESSSCPVAFYWNGERYAYRADFLGGGGLGFLVAPGVYGEPDPEEVLLLGRDLAPRDGALEVRVTEPMEETSFLDRAELLEVVHAPDTLAIPEERFATDGRPASGRVLVVREAERVFPSAARVTELEPFDAGRHVRAAQAATQAPAPSERDDSIVARLAAVDRAYAGPPVLHRRLLGYAAEWALELELPADARLLAEPERVHLFTRGWVEYPYSRLNYAAAQGGIAGEAPSLEVPDGHGGWRTVRPQFGYMGGKERTLVLPIGEHLAAARDGDRLRFRLRTNLPVYFDELYLAADRADTDLVELRRHAPLSATVGFCGFPKVGSPDGTTPDVYDFSDRDVTTDFKPMPGYYTRFGDALDLVLASDDRFAIFGRGEEVFLRFPAPEPLPPSASGARRTWMLDARGYCKDMCPLSSNPDGVEPLPFAAMANYPPEVPLGDAHPSHGDPRNGRRVEAEARTRPTPPGVRIGAPE